MTFTGKAAESPAHLKTASKPACPLIAVRIGRMHTDEAQNARQIVIAAGCVFVLSAAYLATPLMHTTTAAWFETGSLSFELVKGMPAAFVALVIGVIAAVITYRQMLIARAKLRLDLFEARYELYTVLWTFLSRVHGEANQELRDAWVDLNNSIPKAAFLFGSGIGNYFADVSGDAREYIRLDRKLREIAVDAPDRLRSENKVMVASERLDSHIKGLREKFAPYLAFETWH